MVERGELITVCRQIGGMMEAGVDILRITRVLRAQTDNPRLLQLYQALDHDLTMGQSLSDAMAHAPDVWSPFAVSLVQQGEDRNDLAGAFLKVADFLQQEEVVAHDIAAHEAAEIRAGMAADSMTAVPMSTHVAVPVAGLNAPATPLSVIALDGLIDRLQGLGLRALTICAGLLLALAGVWWSEEAGLLEPRWINVTLCSVSALFIGAAGVWVQRRIQAERRREARCSFCGQSGHDGADLERAPRFAGAAICARCASIVARRHAPLETPEATSSETARDDSHNAANDGAKNGSTIGGANRHATHSPGAKIPFTQDGATNGQTRNGNRAANSAVTTTATPVANAVSREEDYE